jgi:hypothetical protein
MDLRGFLNGGLYEPPESAGKHRQASASIQQASASIQMLADESTASICKHRQAAAAGGRACASVLSSERRSEIARKAASARWSKNKRHPLGFAPLQHD